MLTASLAQPAQGKAIFVKSITSSFNKAMSHLNIFILIITFHLYYTGKVFDSVIKWIVYTEYREIRVMPMVEVS